MVPISAYTMKHPLVRMDEHESRRLSKEFLFDGEAEEVRQGLLREGWPNVMSVRLSVRTVQI